MSRMFFFGFGYIAARLAPHLKAAGWEMAGTTRTQNKVNEMWDAGVEPHIWDGENPIEKPARVLKGTTHVLHSIPPGTMGDVVMHHHRALVAKLAPRLTWYGYLSTTGVYGFAPSGLVDEDFQINPENATAKLRARVEKTHLGFLKNSNLPVNIFRLGGIYGPERGILTRIRKGQKQIIIKDDHKTCRVHIDDIVTTLLASINNPKPGRIYNVVDDLPSSGTDPAILACELLGMPVPPKFDYAEKEENLSLAMRAHFKVNRAISNQRIKDELGVVLKYPTYREGFRALVADINKPKSD